MALLRMEMSRKDGGVVQSRDFGRTYPVPQVFVLGPL